MEKSNGFVITKMWVRMKKFVSVSVILVLLSSLCCVQAFAEIKKIHNYTPYTLIVGETENLVFRYELNGWVYADFDTILKYDENGKGITDGTALSTIYLNKSGNNVRYSVTGWIPGSYRLVISLKNIGNSTESSANSIIYHNYVLTVTDKNFTVNFDANGGNVATSSKTVEYKTVYGNLPVPTRAGYVFDGWYTEQTGGTQITASSVFTQKEDQRLFAHWSKASYTVKFDTNGGNSTVSDKTVTYGSAYGTLPTPTRTGYRFVGWFTDVMGGDRVYSDTKVTLSGNQTLYAHWVKNTYTVIFDPNGGTSSVYEKELSYGSKYGELPTPTREHYDFKGWYTAAEGGTKVTALDTFKASDTVTLYAQWTPQQCIVYFDANGGTVTPEYQYVTYNAAYGSLPVPTREGYTFVNWYTRAQYGIPVTADSVVDFSEEQVLYAHWEKSVTAVTGLTLSQSAVTLRPNETATLTATVMPSDATNSAVSWSSSDTAVATVSDGVITAHAVGTATITATTADGGYSATCAVTVKKPASGNSSITAGGPSFKIELDGDTSVGTVYAALYSATGKLNAVKQYDADDTVTVTFDSGATGAYVKIMWLDEKMSPLCSATTIPLQ